VCSPSRPLLFFSSRYASHRVLPSFPTRRSSDLVGALPREQHGHGAAYARVRPGHQRRKALQLAAAAVLRRVGLGLQLQIGLATRSEEHTSELQSLTNLVCRLLLEKKKTTATTDIDIMGLQTAYANLTTAQERDYVMQRYHHGLSSCAGLNSHDADTEPLVVMRSHV